METCHWSVGSSPTRSVCCAPPGTSRVVSVQVEGTLSADNVDVYESMLQVKDSLTANQVSAEGSTLQVDGTLTAGNVSLNEGNYYPQNGSTLLGAGTVAATIPISGCSAWPTRWS